MEITAPNGTVASYDSAFLSDIDYTKNYVKINGATWNINSHSIDLGVGYNHSGGDVLFNGRFIILILKSGLLLLMDTMVIGLHGDQHQEIIGCI